MPFVTVYISERDKERAAEIMNEGYPEVFGGWDLDKFLSHVIHHALEGDY